MLILSRSFSKLRTLASLVLAGSYIICLDPSNKLSHVVSFWMLYPPSSVLLVVALPSPWVVARGLLWDLNRLTVDHTAPANCELHFNMVCLCPSTKLSHAAVSFSIGSCWTQWKGRPWKIFVFGWRRGDFRLLWWRHSKVCMLTLCQISFKRQVISMFWYCYV